MTDIRLDEVVSCKLCGSLMTRGDRPWHLAWHARINARLHDVKELKEKNAL